MARPLVTVQSPSGKGKPSFVKFPEVLLSPIRSDIVVDVHTKMNKNHRQAYAVSALAGADTSAVSWGTGRAVSRIPRVSGGGTNRSGQGAFGNMCRKGRMFAPTKVWRRWHVKVSVGQKRYATCSALAATAVAPLVLARGHRISNIPEVPLVIGDAEIQGISKTKEAIELLKSLGCEAELKKVVDSRHIRAGKGKARNRRYVQAKGPLIIHDKTKGATIEQAFRNIPGVELANVSRLNFLKLAPGGHLGRFVIWTESAFRHLDKIFGTRTRSSTKKRNFRPPRAVLTNSDISRIINSHEVQSRIRHKLKPLRHRRSKNPLRNFRVMAKLNPAAVVLKREKRKEQLRLSKRSKEEIKKDKKAKRMREQMKMKRIPNTAFKQLLHTVAPAPVRSAIEIGVLAGNK